MVTKNLSALAPAYLAVRPKLASTWVAPVQGIRMSGPASRLGSIAGVSTATCTITANAAKGATRKDAVSTDAQGGEAFEDPV